MAIQLNEEREAHHRKTTAAMIQAEEEVRSDIGKEMHDNVNQLLTTVKLYLKLSLQQSADRDALMRKSIALLTDSIHEIRDLF